MKAAKISELKKELAKLDHDELFDVCVRLAKFKVESKELLTYLLMKADNEIGYADELCDEIDASFNALSMNGAGARGSGRIHKKTLRKIVRWMDKSLRFSGDKETELQVRIHFCRQIKEKRISFGGCRVSANLYATQLKKIDKAIEKVHPDLQFDYNHQLSAVTTAAYH
jgi:hypothetical protein